MELIVWNGILNTRFHLPAFTRQAKGFLYYRSYKDKEKLLLGNNKC